MFGHEKSDMVRRRETSVDLMSLTQEGVSNEIFMYSMDSFEIKSVKRETIRDTVFFCIG